VVGVSGAPAASVSTIVIDIGLFSFTDNMSSSFN
jgi:hypothetical protein